MTFVMNSGSFLSMISEANSHIDAMSKLDTTTSDYLTVAGRIVVTEASLSFDEAMAMGLPVHGSVNNRMICYGSFVIPRKHHEDDARRIAEERGWNETLVGFLDQVLRYQSINPAHLPVFRN